MFFAITAANAAPVTGYSGTWKGQSAEAQFSDESGGGSVTVFQNVNGPVLHYAIWGNDPTSEVCTFVVDGFGNTIEICRFTRSIYEYGWGKIPAADIQFTPQFAHLATTTDSTFTSTRCTTDKSTATPVTTCAPSTGGTFDLTWTVNGNYTSNGNGVDQKTYGSFIFKTNGGYKGSSAYANGTALGSLLTDAPGELRDTNGKNVTKTITTN
jgi:hypothetical protein